MISKSIHNFQISAATIVAVLTSSIALGAEVCLDLSGLSEGATVEGPGKVYSSLDIQNATGSGSIVKIIHDTSDATYAAYGAGAGHATKNGGIAAGGGFSNVVRAKANAKHEYNFVFSGGVSVFQLTMRDFGDWNPTSATAHQAFMIAYDSSDSPLGEFDKLEYTTPAQKNPTSSDPYGPLVFANGDALDSGGNPPGVYNFTVQAPANGMGVQFPDIYKLELTFPVGFDPKIGFDTLCFDEEILGVYEVEIDIKPSSYPNSFSIDGNGVIPVAINGSAEFDVTWIDITTLDFAGLSVRVKGNGNPQCSVKDWNGDGFEDLVCQFVDDETLWSPGEGVATVRGLLLDGTPIEGVDTINVK